ncbi:uncharacterized protein V1516DRAFT_689108 [Lipomyces oligophaga]|uniref:uncharacterized protein n=1 Tax=Lipomyces oligophaga TaxID=45792 RepID=UPI0034CEF10E
MNGHTNRSLIIQEPEKHSNQSIERDPIVISSPVPESSQWRSPEENAMNIAMRNEKSEFASSSNCFTGFSNSRSSFASPSTKTEDLKLSSPNTQSSKAPDSSFQQISSSLTSQSQTQTQSQSQSADDKPITSLNSSTWARKLAYEAITAKQTFESSVVSLEKYISSSPSLRDRQIEHCYGKRLEHCKFRSNLGDLTYVLTFSIALSDINSQIQLLSEQVNAVKNELSSVIQNCVHEISILSRKLDTTSPADLSSSVPHSPTSVIPSLIPPTAPKKIAKPKLYNIQLTRQKSAQR